MDGPTTSATDSSAHTSPCDSSVENHAEETTHEESSVGQQYREVLGHGGVRGPGCGRGRNQRQRVGEFFSETENRVLALLRERLSFDAFLDPSNKRACFCHPMYNILEDMGETWRFSVWIDCTASVCNTDRQNIVVYHLHLQSIHTLVLRIP